MTEVAPGIHLVEIPIPVALRAVNCYVLKGREGATIVDTGFHTPQTELAWEAALSELGLGFGDVEKIVVTHFHPDHYGAAGWLQRRTGAPVLMPVTERPQVERTWSAASTAAERLAAFFSGHGLPPELGAAIADVQQLQRSRVQPQPDVTWLPEGQPVAFGGRTWIPIWTPGHSEGLMVFWSESDRLLLADDMILARITPNISLWPGMTVNPLRQFLASLDKVNPLPAALTLTGHRRLVPDLQQRVAELKEHHRQRLQVVKDAVADGRSAAWDVGLAVFGPHDDPHNVRFALAETLAHLEYLVEEGALLRTQEGSQIRYRIAAASRRA
jgi:glyoxylase-like metal-dependent hydrolase (beta-lactamase superfamily II)